MRELGVSELSTGTVKIRLGNPVAKEDDVSEKEQQRLRDERERRKLTRARALMLAASPRIGPALREVR